MGAGSGGLCWELVCTSVGGEEQPLLPEGGWACLWCCCVLMCEMFPDHVCDHELGQTSKLPSPLGTTKTCTSV